MGRSLWVFGYGSLMWNPGFAFEQTEPAILDGWHRAFCRLSWRHRGTPEAPGMVAGLMPGGACHGRVFRVAAHLADDALAYLDEREGPGYHRRELAVRLPNADDAPEAIVYVPNPEHPTYAGDLPRAEVVRLIATGVGQSGRAVDYLADLVTHLDELGIAEPVFREILAEVRRYGISTE